VASEVALWAYLSLRNGPAAAYNPRIKEPSKPVQQQQQMSHFALQIGNSEKRQVAPSFYLIV
jgi:hypothetical protein